MRPSAARSLAGCSSPRSPRSSLFRSCSPCCAVRNNLKTWLQRIREDCMTEQLVTGKRLLWFLVVPAVLACSAFVTVYARRTSSESLAATTKTLALQNVNVVHAAPGSPVTDLTVPGTVQAFSESPIYARTNGYLRIWNADIGAQVRKGQPLAVIDAPEVDQGLRSEER